MDEALQATYKFGRTLRVVRSELLLLPVVLLAQVADLSCHLQSSAQGPDFGAFREVRLIALVQSLARADYANSGGEIR